MSNIIRSKPFKLALFASVAVSSLQVSLAAPEKKASNAHPHYAANTVSFMTAGAEASPSTTKCNSDYTRCGSGYEALLAISFDAQVHDNSIDI